uniref:SFRICE_018535 n=1 Tax=Spodoptera frugiperda TaxID=7108 RepID=A0A2H1W3D1_SPOFR
MVKNILLYFLGLTIGSVSCKYDRSDLKQTNRIRIHHTKSNDNVLLDLWTRSDLDEASTYNPEEMNTYHLFTRKTDDCLVGRVVAIATAGQRVIVFDSRVGRSITELFLVFRKFVSSSTESGNVPSIWHIDMKQNPTLSEPILTNNELWLETTHYNASKRTVVLIHGWLDTVTSDFVTVLVQAILQAEDANVIAVDWSPGSGTINYPVAVLNTPISAHAVAKFLNWLNNVSGSRLEDYHIIGHGLGAHQAGIAGRILGGWVGYITALDPAFPGWVTNEDRFKPTDGMYTEAIHTNAGVLGYLSPVADADFYPNGGIDMPGCYSQECDHNRSYHYLAESIISGGFIGSRCYTHGSAMSGHCFLGGKLRMGGINSKPGQASTGPHQTHTTASTDPHCTDRIIGNADMRCVLMTHIAPGTFPHSVLLRNFRKPEKMPSNTLPDSGIEP